MGDGCDVCDDVGGKTCEGDSEGGDCDGEDRSTAEPNKGICCHHNHRKPVSLLTDTSSIGIITTVCSCIS